MSEQKQGLIVLEELPQKYQGRLDAYARLLAPSTEEAGPSKKA